MITFTPFASFAAIGGIILFAASIISQWLEIRGLRKALREEIDEHEADVVFWKKVSGDWMADYWRAYHEGDALRAKLSRRDQPRKAGRFLTTKPKSEAAA